MVHAQSKAIIEQALHNDTQFLSECNIMDYSLLVGIDDEKKEMIVGIVGKFVTIMMTIMHGKEITNENKHSGRACCKCCDTI